MSRIQSTKLQKNNLDNALNYNYKVDHNTSINNSFISLINALDNSSRRNREFNFQLERIKSAKKKPEFLTEKNIKDYQLVPLHDYKKEIKNLMSNYRLETEPLEDKTKKLKETILDNSLSSNITVKVEHEEYKNPIESYNILKRNKSIYNDVMNKVLLRQQKINFDKSNELLKSMITPTVKVKISKGSNKHDLTPSKNQLNKPSTISLDVFSNGVAEMYGYYQYCKRNIPESREQFSFCYDLGYGYIFGGQSTKPKADLWSFNPTEMEFKRLRGDSYTNPRLGHSANIYQKKMFLFGGKIKINSNNFSYFGDLEIFNFEDNTWTTPSINSKLAVRPRRNHSTEIVGNQLLVYGGFSDDNIVLNDCYTLNLTLPYKWSKVIIDNFDDTITTPFLAGHTSCLVFPAEIQNNPKFSLQKVPDIIAFQRRNRNKIKEKGIYFFGGRNEITFSNELWILKIGSKIQKFIKPDTKGKAPCPRYLHSMNFYEECNFLIVYGGKNDNLESDFNDIFIFELFKMEWLEIKLFSSNPITVYKRYGHTGVIDSNKLIFFGGMNSQNYIGSSLFIIDLESCYSYSDLDEKKKGKEDKYLFYSKEILKMESPVRRNGKKREITVNSNRYLPAIK